jgi:glycoside/pentoside/hexuronide:cation symporter, GPH family
LAVAEGVGGVAAPGTAPAAEVGLKPPVRVKLAYCFGQVVESSYLTINTFVFFYYTAVLGLSGSLVGLAVAISMVIDAVLDPLIGSWSDSVRSRFGRRLPVMLVGAPLTFLTMGLLFTPPAGMEIWALFVWLTAFKMGVRGFASMFNIPYFALGGEMTDGYVERTRIVAYRLLAGIITSVTVFYLGYSVFFAGEGGLQRPERYPAFGWSIAALVLAGGLICCAGLWRFAASLPQPLTPTKGMLGRLPAELAEIFRNRSFLILFFSLFLFSSAYGAHQALGTHAAVFLWRLRPETIQILAYVGLFGIFAAMPLTPFLMNYIEKKTAAALGFLLTMAAFTVLPGLRAAGLFMLTGDEALPALMAGTFVIGVGFGMIGVAYPAMMADAADEHEHLFGSRREGLFFSGLGFGGKAAAGMGALVGGVALDLLRFPREVGRQVNAVVEEPVLIGLVFAWGIVPAVLCLVGAAVFMPYAISRARQTKIAAALKVKRADDVSAGLST